MTQNDSNYMDFELRDDKIFKPIILDFESDSYIRFEFLSKLKIYNEILINLKKVEKILQK